MLYNSNDEGGTRSDDNDDSTGGARSDDSDNNEDDDDQHDDVLSTATTKRQMERTKRVQSYTKQRKARSDAAKCKYTVQHTRTRNDVTSVDVKST